MRLLLAAVLTCVVTTQASAQIAQPIQPPAGATGREGKPDKLVCRKEIPTGSHFARRLCHTASQWAEFDGLGRKEADHLGAHVGTVGFGNPDGGQLK